MARLSELKTESLTASLISTAPTGTNPPDSAFARITMSGSTLKAVRGQERSGAVHAGLHFIQNEERAVPAAEFLGGEQVVRVRNADTAFGLHRLHDERRELVRGQVPLQFDEIAERDALRAGQHGAEARAPERVAHQRERTAGQAVERTLGIKQSVAAGVARART